ncbi:hypothetical protein Pfo_004659 [Paulownia fortunei]|nr:hypothetical protein Pfo_004659 [Paulownia fortunei]
MLSPEDVAWADSCLTKDPEVLDSGWDSMKDALLETLSTQSNSSAHEKDKFSEGPKMEIFPSGEETGDVHNLVKSDISTADSSEGAEPSSGDQLTYEKTDDFWSRHNMEDVFLPSYSDSLIDLGTSDPEVDLVVQAFQMDQSTEDIFKVWDLDIPPEEDDLIKQLKKALVESSLEPTTSVSDHSEAWKGLNDESLDDIISGIADLSLSPNLG